MTDWQAVARALGPEWTVVDPVDGRYPAPVALLDGPGLLRVRVDEGNWIPRGKYKLAGSYTRLVEQGVADEDDCRYEDTVTINVSQQRPDTQIAREIQSRLVPPYREHIRAIRERAHARRWFDERMQKALCAIVARAPAGSAHEISIPGDSYERVVSVAGLTVRIDRGYAGPLRTPTRVTIKEVRGLAPNQAAYVVRALLALPEPEPEPPMPELAPDETATPAKEEK